MSHLGLATRSDYDNLWQKCYEESREPDDTLFSHLTYLVVVYYLAKQETQKLRLFTYTLYATFPMNTQKTFKSHGRSCPVRAPGP